MGGPAEVEVGAETDTEPPWTRFFQVEIPEVPPGLTVAESAVLSAGLEYKAPQEAVIEEGASVADLQWQKIEAVVEAEPSLTDRAMALLRRLLVQLLAGLLLLGFLPGWTGGLTSQIAARPWVSLLWGLVGLVAIPVALLVIVPITILLAVVFGYLGLSAVLVLVILSGVIAEVLVAVFSWAFLSFVAPVLVALLIGRWLVMRLRSGQAGGVWPALVVGVLILTLLRAVPILGSILALLVALLAFGSLCLWGWRLCRPEAGGSAAG